MRPTFLAGGWTRPSARLGGDSASKLDDAHEHCDGQSGRRLGDGRCDDRSCGRPQLRGKRRPAARNHHQLDENAICQRAAVVAQQRLQGRSALHWITCDGDGAHVLWARPQATPDHPTNPKYENQPTAFPR